MGLQLSPLALNGALYYILRKPYVRVGFGGFTSEKL
jgi:hypothetical protein